MAMVLEHRLSNEMLAVDACAPVLPQMAETQAEQVPAGGTGSAAAARIQIRTVRFGTLDVEEDLVITFPEGIIGFEHCVRFLVVRSEEGGAFRWLQSLDQPAVAFPIIEPNEFRSDYAPTISDTDARLLDLRRTLPILLFAIVTIPANNPRAMTANLLGPLVINPMTRRGKQVIIQDEGFSTRHSLVAELARNAKTSQQSKEGNSQARVKSTFIAPGRKSPNADSAHAA